MIHTTHLLNTATTTRTTSDHLNCHLYIVVCEAQEELVKFNCDAWLIMSPSTHQLLFANPSYLLNKWVITFYNRVQTNWKINTNITNSQLQINQHNIILNIFLHCDDEPPFTFNCGTFVIELEGELIYIFTVQFSALNFNRIKYSLDMYAHTAGGKCAIFPHRLLFALWTSLVESGSRSRSRSRRRGGQIIWKLEKTFPCLLDLSWQKSLSLN